MKKILLYIICCSHVYHAPAQFYVSQGAKVFLTGEATLSLNDVDLVNNGTVESANNGKVVFNGASESQISGRLDAQFGIIEIAKTGSVALKLHTRIVVTNKVQFTSGLIDLNGNVLDLGTTGFLEGETENSRLTGLNGGYAMIVTSLSAPVGENPGNLGAVITSPEDFGLIAIRRGHQPQVTAGGSTPGIHRYYELDPMNNENLNAILRLYYFDAEKNSMDESLFRLWTRTPDAAWMDKGFASRNPVEKYVEQSGINSVYLQWTLAPAGVLPVTGMQLIGIWKNNAAQLTWTTLTELGNSHFILQRKYDDEQHFSQVHRINSAHTDGNSSYTTNYSLTDYADHSRGRIQYRIQQFDRDGNASYSNVVVVKPEPASAFIAGLYPAVNVQSQIYVKTGNRNLKQMIVTVFDMSGRQLINREYRYQSQWINLPRLADGVYKILIRSTDEQWYGTFKK